LIEAERKKNYFLCHKWHILKYKRQEMLGEALD
jgi:hypothetical protein